MDRVCSASEVPKVIHWVILKFSSVYIPEDERSRTNPGHGYPAKNVPVVSYEAYAEYAEWRLAVEKLEGAQCRQAYFAAKVTPAKVTTQTSINVDWD